VGAEYGTEKMQSALLYCLSTVVSREGVTPGSRWDCPTAKTKTGNRPGGGTHLALAALSVWRIHYN